MHAREPWDEASIWAVPGSLDREVVYAIAAETPPTEAVLLHGPAKMPVIRELELKLRNVLSKAGVTVFAEACGDD